MISLAVCAVAAGVAAALLLPVRSSIPLAASARVVTDEGWLRRWRWPLATLAGASVMVLLDGVPAVAGALVVGVVAYRVLAASEPPGAAAARARAARDLPHLVLLVAAGLRSGAAPTPALARACEALPGPAADRLRPVVARLSVGVPAVEVWRDLSADQVLAPLGAALARSVESGASVVDAVERLAEELAAEARGAVEDRARTVGVRAALPLGLCLLPAFLVIGIVPLVAALLGELMRR